jgi:hypothetical protein
MGDGIQEAVSTSAERIIKFFCQAGKLPWSLGLGLVIENACNGRIETRPGRHSRCANVTWIWAKCPIAITALLRNLSSGQNLSYLGNIDTLNMGEAFVNLAQIVVH